ncbi:OmpA family protein [Crenobacter sp. SG2303]|uniref:OmpA family protein n=1 Tax=Crenobacter oryzisoli TaxID=3056844 RepID=A0ABT7XNU0_9NEIS|nr:OmpA family protein [Crenobacter sp. SG2303]MDN0075467.1 OmpA family protein [Crenobacter sp. SG2303]
MSINLLELTSGALGDDFVQLVSSLFGEDVGKIGKGISTLVPAVLGGIAQEGATPEGAQGLLSALDSVPTDIHLPEQFGKQLATPESRDELQQIGHGLLNQLFGDKIDALTDAVSSVSGIGHAVSGHAGEQITLASGGDISREVSGGLLTLVTPAIFSVVKKVVGENKLDAGGLSRLLSEQHDTLLGALNPQLTSMLGFGSATAFLGSLTGKFSEAAQDAEARAKAVAAKVSEPVSTVVAEASSKPRRWWPWLLLILVALAAFPLLNTKPTAEKATPTVDETASAGSSAATAASAPAGTASAPMASTDSAPASSTAGPAKVYFATGQADIDADGQQAIKSAVDAAKSAGGGVDVTGYTDKTGDLHANEELAKKRALAVKDALLAAGLADDKIHMKPPQSVTGAGNDKEARRVEITPAQ